MEDYVTGAERLAGLTPEGVLSIVIIGALVILVIIVYSGRNTGMNSLSNALDRVGNALSEQYEHNSEMEDAFESIVGQIAQIAEVLKDISAMKEDIAHFKTNAQNDALVMKQNRELLLSMDARLSRMETRLDVFINDLTKKVMKEEQPHA